MFSKILTYLINLFLWIMIIAFCIEFIKNGEYNTSNLLALLLFLIINQLNSIVVTLKNIQMMYDDEFDNDNVVENKN